MGTGKYTRSKDYARNLSYDDYNEALKDRDAHIIDLQREIAPLNKVRDTARELATEMDSLLGGYLVDTVPAGALYDFLWDNKAAILRVLQAVSPDSK